MSRPRMTTELAELRDWWRENDTEIMGYVYGDNDSIWNNGDFGVFRINYLFDVGSFFILISDGKTIFRLHPDEEDLTKSKGLT